MFRRPAGAALHDRPQGLLRRALHALRAVGATIRAVSRRRPMADRSPPLVASDPAPTSPSMPAPRRAFGPLRLPSLRLPGRRPAAPEPEIVYVRWELWQWLTEFVREGTERRVALANPRARRRAALLSSTVLSVAPDLPIRRPTWRNRNVRPHRFIGRQRYLTASPVGRRPPVRLLLAAALRAPRLRAPPWPR
jgi:hypothetical protein